MDKMEKVAKKLRTAVIYARYSSHNQRDVSIEQQVEECRYYAQREDIDVLRIYADRAISGTTDARPQFQAMLRDAQHAKWDYVICYKVDRFARNRYDSATYKYKLKKAGTKVLYAKEAIPEGPEGVLLEAVLEGSAEYYSENLAQNVRRGLAYNAEKCLVCGVLPFGYEKGPDRRYAVHPGEAEIVREIFRRVDAGELQTNIAADLNRRGYKTRTGHKWTAKSLPHLLRNENYIGVYTYCGTHIEGGVPIIVDTELFQSVQSKLKKLQHKPGRRTENGEYLLTGKLYCGLCEERMVGVSATGRHGELHFYYACNGRIKKKTCEKKNIVRSHLEDMVVQMVMNVLTNDDIVNQIADAAMRFQEAEAASSQAAFLEESLVEARNRQQRLIDAIEQGISTPGILERIQSVEAEMAEYEESLRLERAKLHGISREALVQWILSFRTGDIADQHYRSHLIDAFVGSVYLWDDHIRIGLNFTGSGNAISADLMRSDSLDSGFVLAEMRSAKLALYEPGHLILERRV